MVELTPEIPASLRGCCLTLGNFDGVHLGHRKMLRELRRLGKELQCPTVAVTFHPHPIAVLRPDSAPPLLTTIERRLELLKQTGIDAVWCLPVTRPLLQMTAREFFDGVLVQQFGLRGIVEGPNFMFGRDRTGTTDSLRQFCREQGIDCSIVPLEEIDGREYSSTRIRMLLRTGHVQEAAELLGRPHEIAGIVAQGDQRGRRLGTPTANLESITTLIPAHGVYACEALVAGRRYAAAVNVGPNPTFSSETAKLEAHLPGFSGDLYDQTLTLRFLRRLREIQKFQNEDQLRSQIQQDIAACLSTFDARQAASGAETTL